MPLEMRQRYDDVGIGYGRTYFGRLAVGTAFNGQFAAFGTLEPVGYYYVAFGLYTVEPVFHCACEMVNGV